MVLIGAILLHSDRQETRQPKIKDFPAYTSIPISIGDQVKVTLPPVGWRIVNPEDDYMWVKKEKYISSHFMLRDYSMNPPWTGTQDEWEELVLEESRQFLLDDFLEVLWTEWDPAPGQVMDWAKEDGTQQVYSELWGDAHDGSRNHILLIPLFPQKLVLPFQSSTSMDLEWEELREYVQEWIFPLIDEIEISNLKSA